MKIYLFPQSGKWYPLFYRTLFYLVLGWIFLFWFRLDQVVHTTGQKGLPQVFDTVYLLPYTVLMFLFYLFAAWVWNATNRIGHEKKWHRIIDRDFRTVPRFVVCILAFVSPHFISYCAYAGEGEIRTAFRLLAYSFLHAVALWVLCWLGAEGSAIIAKRFPVERRM